MPSINNLYHLNSFLDYEKSLRHENISTSKNDTQYWSDLEGVLESYNYKKNGDLESAINTMFKNPYNDVLKPILGYS